MAEQSIHDLFDTVPDPEESDSPVLGKEKPISELFDKTPLVIDRSVDPDRAARIQRAVDELGVPRSVAENRLDELEAKRPTDMSGAPVTEMYMRDRGKAELMSDEAEMLRDKERAMRGFWNNAGRQLLERGQELIGNELEIVGRYLADDPTADIQKQLGVESVLSQARSEAFTKVREYGKELSDEAKGSFDYQPRFDWENFKGEMTAKNLALYALEGGIGSLPDMIGAIVSLPAYAAAFTQEVGEERAKNMGLDEPTLKELAVAFPAALLTAAMERFGARAVFDVLGVFSYKQAAKAAGSAFLKEGTSELVEENVQYAAETIGTNEDYSLAEGIERGVAGFLAGSLFGGAVRGSTATAQATMAKLKRNNSEQDIIDQMDGLAEIKLKGRSKKQYDAYIQDLTSSYGIESVHIDGKVFNQSLIEQHPEVEALISEDGDAEIAMKDYLALPKAIREALRPHVRLNVDSLSQVEAQTYEESQMARMDDLIKNALKDQGDYDRAIEIANVIAAQIEATSAPYTKRQAKLMSRIYVDYLITKAKDQGMTVDEVWNQMQLEVGGPQSTTPFVNLLDQMEIDENRQAEAKGLDMSTEARMARAKEQGFDISRPVYHGTNVDFQEFDPERSIGGQYWSTTDKASIEAGEVGAQGSGVVKEMFHRIKNPAGWKEYDQLGVDELISRGYDGVALPDSDGNTTYIAFEPNQYRSTNAAFDPDYVASPNLLAQSEQTFDQKNRASIEIFPNKAIIRLSEASDLSSFFHESGHFFLEMEKRFAAHPNATDRQKKDFQSILDFIGAPDGNIQTEHHEKFARAFEMYIAEGRAPSVELRPFFRRFAQWIVQVYKSLRNLDVELTPEIRGVMDRMLATEAEIERAHQKFGFDIAFNSAKQVLTGKHKAKEDLRAKLIKELKDRQTKVWKQEKSEKVDRIKKELSESRLYKTIDRLKETPISREDVLESLDIENLSGRKRKSTLTSNVLPIRPSTVENVEGMSKLKGLTAEKGLPLDEAAQLNGYPSGQAMLHDILANPTLAQEADSRADAEMFKEHGDMLSDGSIEELADRAVLNNDQAKALLEELRALKRGKVDREAIEQEAKALVGKMPADKINPEKYYRLAIKEAHLYQKAMSAKKFDEAAKHKEQQLKLFYVAREAQIMKDRTKRMMKSLKGWQTREYRPTEVDPEYAQNLRTYALLYDFSKTDKERAKRDLSKLARWLESQAKDENNFLKPVILDEIMNKLLDAEIQNRDIDIPSYKEMTIDELQGVFDMATHFRYAGGQLSKSAKAERELVADELAESIESNAKGKDILPKDVKTNWDKWKPTFSRFFDDHIVLRNKIALLDGFTPGAAKKFLYDAVSAANNRFVDMQMDASRRLQDVFDGHHVRLFKRGAGLKTIQKENGGTYTLGLRERIMLGVYWGSPESRKALIEGQGITEAEAQKMLDHLTDKDLDLIEKIWEFNDYFWPEFSAQTTRMHGSTPPKVENAPFEVNGRKMSGGYMRLYYEHGHKDSARKDIDADSSETSRGSASLAMTRAGASYERVGSGGRRLELDVINIGRATEETVHGLAFSEVSRDIQNILNNEKVSGALEKKYGLPFLQSLRDTYKGIFAKGGSAGGMSKVMAKGRSNLTYAYLAYSVRNVMQQPTAIFNVVGKMGEVETVKAIVTVASSPKYWAQLISERSSFMRNRFALVNREAAEQLMKIDTNKMNATLKQYAFSLQTIADSLVAYPAWVAGYKEGQRLYPADETLAVQHADDIVASTVGSGMSKDLSAMMAGFGVAGSSGDKASEFTKQFTFMGSFFSTIHNLMAEACKKNNLKTPMGLLNYSRQMMWYLVAPALISQLIVSSYPEDDDPEAWLAWMAKNIAQYGLATTFLLRDIGSGLSGFSPSIPWQSIPTAVIRGGKEATEAFSDGGFQLDDTASIIRAASVFVPLYGAGQVARSLDYWNSYQEGNEGDFSLYDLLVEGKERNE